MVVNNNSNKSIKLRVNELTPSDYYGIFDLE